MLGTRLSEGRLTECRKNLHYIAWDLSALQSVFFYNLFNLKDPYISHHPDTLEYWIICFGYAYKPRTYEDASE